MITDIISILRTDEFYGGGEFTEIAKGKNEHVSTCADFKRKIKRIWLRKKL